MADIATTDLTYTKQEGTSFGNPANPEAGALYKIVFGDGALTYPSGGIPLTRAKLGCPARLSNFTLIDTGAAVGYSYKYDYVNEKLRIYVGASHAHDILIKGAQAAAGTAATAWYATDIFGKEAAADKTILGSASATKGGVLTGAAGTLAELGNVAVSATTIYARVSGY